MIDGRLNRSQKCPGSQEGQLCPEEHQTQHCQPKKGEAFPTLLCTGEALPEVLLTVLGTTI